MKNENIKIKDEYYSKSKKADWIVITMDANLESRGAWSDLMTGNISLDEFNEIVDELSPIEIITHHFGNNKKMSGIFIKGLHVGQSIYNERTSIVPKKIHDEFMAIIS